MVILSTLFREGLQHRNCSNDVMHPNGCVVNALYNLYGFTLSNAKYFAPIVFLPPIMKARKLNRDTIKNVLRYYVEAVVTGVMSGWTIATVICILRYIFGEFRLYTFVYIPSLVGSCITMLTTKSVRRLFHTSTIQSAIESLLIRRRNYFTRLLAASKGLQTLVFMLCSATILQTKRYKSFNAFWFLSPERRNTMETPKGDENSSATNLYCLGAHQGRSCISYIAKAIGQYTMYGLCLDFVRMLFRKVPTEKAANGLLQTVAFKLCFFRAHSAIFLTSYVGIYRFLLCNLNRYTTFKEQHNHLLAAFLGGSSFALYPNLSLLSYGIVMTMEVLWRWFKAQPRDKLPAFMHHLKGLPLSQIFYTFSMGYIVHSYVLRENLVSQLGEVIINGVTNNYAKNVTVRVKSIERSLTK